MIEPRSILTLFKKKWVRLGILHYLCNVPSLTHLFFQNIYATLQA